MVEEELVRNNNGAIGQNLMLMLEGGEIDSNQVIALNGVSESKKKSKKMVPKKSSKKVASTKLGDGSQKSLRNPNSKSESASSKLGDTVKSGNEFPLKANEGERNYKLL